MEEEFNGKSIFSVFHQNGYQTKKIFGYSYIKVTVVVLMSHFRGMLVFIFRKIKCNKEK